MAETIETDRLDLSGFPADILDLVLEVVPELRICALAIRRVREKRVAYPLTEASQVQALMDEVVLQKEQHLITKPHVVQYLTVELFPVEDERDFAAKVYLALLRCRMASRPKVPLPVNSVQPPLGGTLL